MLHLCRMDIPCRKKIVGNQWEPVATWCNMKADEWLCQLWDKMLISFKKSLAGEPGFEPGLTESESVGLPLTYSPKLRERQRQ